MSNFSNILPIWNNKGTVDFIYYKKEDIINYAILIMSIKKKKGSYDSMIKKIKLSLANNVFTLVAKKKIRIAQGVSDYCKFRRSSLNSSRDQIIPFWVQALMENNGNEQILGPMINETELIFEILDISGDGIFGSVSKPQITKLSLCRQVELKKHEATVIDDLVLYVNMTRKLVLDFVAIRDLRMADIRVRVCLDEFPYDQLRISSSSSCGIDVALLVGVLFYTLALSLCS